jgi:GNAT superfamily N-acetyltransferase
MRRSEPEAIRQRFETGRRCFGFEVDDRIVSFGWMTPGAEETGELERTLSIPAGEAYVWDCGTVPDHRRLGLYSSLLNRILFKLQDEGVPRVWIGSSRLNTPSIRGIANAGFQHVIDLTYRRIALLTLIVLRAAPDAPPAAVTAARRILLKPGEWAAGPIAVGWLA